MHHEAIRSTLTHHAGSAPDANAVAEATINTWHQMAARLMPVIGTRVVEVLFSRSLHLTSLSIPWLSIVGDYGDTSVLLAALKTRLAERKTEDAEEASHALLLTFTELLTTLIGKPLTERLLAPVWVHPSPESERENPP